MAAATMAYPARDFFQSYPPHYPTYPSGPHQVESGQPRSLTIDPYYTSYISAPQTNHYQPSPARPTQTSQSPASESEHRPLLPSISNLLGLTNDTRPTEATQQPPLQTPSPRTQQTPYSTSYDRKRRRSPSPQDMPASKRPMMSRPSQFRSDSVMEPAQSPSNLSNRSSLSTGNHYFLGSTLNNVEATSQRIIHSLPPKFDTLPSQPNASPYKISPSTSAPYTRSPGAISAGFGYPLADPNLARHRLSLPPPPPPLPSNYPLDKRLSPTATTAAPGVITAGPLQHHHHYINPSQQAGFPASQDRYICATCNKAFSRPSSLKIHSHSHTGEKPYRCPQMGCGKAFSVRSNMKRHEKGCHVGTAQDRWC